MRLLTGVCLSGLPRYKNGVVCEFAGSEFRRPLVQVANQRRWLPAGQALAGSKASKPSNPGNPSDVSSSNSTMGAVSGMFADHFNPRVSKK